MRTRSTRNRLATASSSSWPRPFDSSSLSVEALEARQLLTVSVSGIHLTNDTGASSSDAITSNAAVAGTTTGAAPSGGSAAIQFDHNGDGTVDGSATVFGGAFSYDPVAHDTALANWEASLALRYRVAEFNGYGSPVSFGDWQNFGLTLDRVAPQASGFVDVNVNQGTQSSTVSLGAAFNDGVTADSALSYQIVSNSRSVMFNSTSISQGTLTLNYNIYQYGTANIVIRATDQAGNSRDATLHVVVGHINSAPIVSGFGATSSIGNIWTLSGSVWDDAGAAGLWVYIGGVLDGYDLWAEVESDGSFSVTVDLPSDFSHDVATAMAWDGEGAESNEVWCFVG